ncbi:MAG: hypothetical protein QOG87_3611 [Actinomycetota bacterium]|jgi:hypothetical protein
MQLGILARRGTMAAMSCDSPIGAEQMRLRADMDAVSDYCEVNLETWAGIHWDNDEPVRIAAYFTADLDRHRAALHAVVQHPDRVDVRLARHTAMEVAAIRWQIHDVLQRTGRSWSSSTGVDTVFIGLAPGSENVQAGLSERFGDLIEFEPWQEREKLLPRGVR